MQAIRPRAITTPLQIGLGVPMHKLVVTPRVTTRRPVPKVTLSSSQVIEVGRIETHIFLLFFKFCFTEMLHRHTLRILPYKLLHFSDDSKLKELSQLWRATSRWNKISEMKFFKNLFSRDVTPGHIENRYHIWYFWAPLEEPSGIFWGRYIWCRIFRRIFWYHSLVPQNVFSGVIQDLGPFLE